MVSPRGSITTCLGSIFLVLFIGIVLRGCAAPEDTETCSANVQREDCSTTGCDCPDDIRSQQEEILKGFQRIDELMQETWTRVRELSEKLHQEERLVAELKLAARVPLEDVKPIRPNTMGGEKEWLEQRRQHSGGSLSSKPEDTGALQHYGSNFQKTIAKHRKSFLEHLTLLAAVRADAEVTAVKSMHDLQGLSRYIAMGDSKGKLYFFAPQGDLLAEYHTGVPAPVTALSFYVVRKNITAVLSGHANGALCIHHVTDQVNRHRYEPALVTIHNITLEKVLLPQQPDENGSAEDRAFTPTGPIKIIATGRSGQNQALVTVDKHSTVRVLYNNNSSPRVVGELSSDIHALRLELPTIYVVHEEGIAVMSTSSEKSVRHVTCEGLNDTTLQAVALDSHNPTRAYAVTKDWNVTSIYVDRQFKACKIKGRRPIRMPPGPPVLKCIKGYLFLATDLGIAVFNTTMATHSGPREVVLEPLMTIAASFGREATSVPAPLLDSNANQLVVLGMGDGLMVFFESHLLTMKPPELNFKLWSQPLFIGVMIIVGLWQFMRHFHGTSPSPGWYDRYGRRRHPY